MSEISIIKWNPEEALKPIVLSASLVKALQKQPMTGKGYQICTVYFKDGVVLAGVPVLHYTEAWLHRSLKKSAIEQIIVDEI